MATPRICSIHGCGKKHEARGWCYSHYSRWQRHGDPLGGRTERGSVGRYFQNVVLAYEGDDCLFWPYSRGRGHAQLRFNNKLAIVSRLVCEHAYGPPPTPKHEAAHSCGNGHLGCVTRRHLRWATSTENKADKVLHGTTSRGERFWAAKLTELDVRAIRALEGTMPKYKIAEKYGVARSTISLIHSRQNWAWLE